MTEIFNDTLIKTNIYIKNNNLTKDLDNCIIVKLKEKYENICSEIGFVEIDSIELLKRSNGYIKDLYNPSLIYFDVYFKCRICNPVQETVISCNIKDNIKPGLIGYLYPLEIIIPITLHKNKDIFNTLQTGDTIKVKILKTKIKLNETHIQAVAILESEDILQKNTIKTNIFEEY